MAKRKITSNFNFSDKQFQSLLKLLKENAHDPDVYSHPYSIDIKIRKDEQLGIVLFSYMDISDPDRPKGYKYYVDIEGKVDKTHNIDIEFEHLSDRVTYFANLKELKLDGIKLNDNGVLLKKEVDFDTYELN